MIIIVWSNLTLDFTSDLIFWGMAAMPFPLWSSHNTVDDSLASFTFTNKFGLLYMEVSLLSFLSHGGWITVITLNKRG